MDHVLFCVHVKFTRGVTMGTLLVRGNDVHPCRVKSIQNSRVHGYGQAKSWPHLMRLVCVFLGGEDLCVSCEG